MLVYALQILSSLMMVSFVFVMNMIAGDFHGPYRGSAERGAGSGQQKKRLSKEVPNGDIDFENVDFSYGGNASNPP